MKLQRTTLILLVSAVLLGGFVYFYEVQGAPKREAAKAAKQSIFSFEEDQIQTVTIYLNQETKRMLEFERVNEKETPWRMKYPKDVPASDASVAFLVNLLVGGKSDRTSTVPADQLKEYGLDQPQATVKVLLKNQQTHQILLGKPDFNGNFLYALVNPSPDQPSEVDVLLVPRDFEYAVNRSLSEWEQTKAEPSESSQESETEKEPPAPEATPSPAEKPESPAPEATPSPAEKPEPPAPEATPSPAEKPEPPAPEATPSPAEENN